MEEDSEERSKIFLYSVFLVFHRQIIFKKSLLQVKHWLANERGY